jgi:hypothetical protein
MDDRVYALDFPPGVEVNPATAYLEDLKAQGIADWRINEYE